MVFLCPGKGEGGLVTLRNGVPSFNKSFGKRDLNPIRPCVFREFRGNSKRLFEFGITRQKGLGNIFIETNYHPEGSAGRKKTPLQADFQATEM